MYQVPEEIRIPYLKAKVIELLLQLLLLKAPEASDGLLFTCSVRGSGKALHRRNQEYYGEQNREYRTASGTHDSRRQRMKR